MLATCRQIYSEAANYFWSDNIWRFSDDEGWEGVFRFLLTIGPVARSRIHRLDILDPNVYEEEETRAWGDEPYIKNHPKLQMAKLSHEEETCHHHKVYNLLIQDQTLRLLNLLVPSGFLLGHISRGEYEADVPLGFLPKVTIVVESGGFLQSGHGIKGILDEGYDIRAFPGSTIVEDPIDGSNSAIGTIITEPRTWTSDPDVYNGVRQLFEEEDFSIHANGGRAHVPNKGKKLERSLSSFGPCMIVVDTQYHRCWRFFCHGKHVLGTSYRSLVG
ncbi:hypothetical protein MMC28_007712 [Mycoblastus sanguinarius]|nr:hypothetical protein [Mycoblastus sanguinarius]